MWSDVGGINKCFGRPIFIFFIKESWICDMTRHHAEPNINILLTINVPFADIQWSHLLTMPLHCLWAKSNNRTHGQFEYDVIWFFFFFYFGRLHERCDCCYIVCLRFQLAQIKQVNCKMSTKNVNNYK